MRWTGVAALFLGCANVDQDVGGNSAFKDFPLAEYAGTTHLDMHDGSRLAWKLATKHMLKWPKSDLIRAAPIDLTGFDSLGSPLVYVTADSGAVDEPVNFMMAKGHVHGKSRKGMELFTDSLRWNKSQNQISTEARVKVITEDGDTLTGRGFLSDANLDHWQILSGVKGTFKKPVSRAGVIASPVSDAPAASDSAGRDAFLEGN